MVKVKFLARFRDITGERSVSIEHSGSIADLMDTLTEKYGNEFKDALFDKEGNLRDYMKIIVNNEDVESNGGLKSEVGDDDEVVIFQTIAGG